MSFGDLFFPGNPARRTHITALSTKIKTYMELNFDSTNALIDLMNKHATPSPNLQHISVDQSKTLKSNAQVLISAIENIQRCVEIYDKRLADSLDPALYRKLNDPDRSFEDVIAKAKQAVSITIGAISTFASIAIILAIKKGTFLVTLATKITKVGATAVAGLVLGVLALGVDAIVSAILGSIERDKLNDTIDNLQSTLDEFEPASRDYNRTITRVELLMDIHLGA
jgi:hypothetical protein